MILLKGQCREIFDHHFFRQLITPRPLINTLKYFRILFEFAEQFDHKLLFSFMSHSTGQKIFVR
jgi:hypothetical protein